MTERRVRIWSVEVSSEKKGSRWLKHPEVITRFCLKVTTENWRWLFVSQKPRHPQAYKISPLQIYYRNTCRTWGHNDNLIWSNRPLDEREQTENGKEKAKERDGPEPEMWFKISGWNLKLNCNVQRQRDDKEIENGEQFPFSQRDT